MGKGWGFADARVLVLPFQHSSSCPDAVDKTACVERILLVLRLYRVFGRPPTFPMPLSVDLIN